MEDQASSPEVPLESESSNTQPVLADSNSEPPEKVMENQEANCCVVF